MALEADEREARRRARELSHYITKREALALCVNLLERHMQLHHHVPASVLAGIEQARRGEMHDVDLSWAPRWWRRLFRKGANG